MTDRINTTPVDDLSAVLGSVGDLVAAVRPDQWHAPTPCPRWDVRDLVNHMVLGSRLFAGVVRCVAAVAPGDLDPRAGDALGDDPVAAYRGAADDLLAAFGQPGVLDRVFEVPAGLVPGIAAIHLRAVEDLVHGWDLAQATGQRPPFPDDIVERQLEFTRAKLADVPTERGPFAPPQPVPDQAAPLERLAALLGRQVDQRRRARVEG
ncbi:TIGR03086 family metal-binding protein [Streptomyces sp. 8K308]|uniref:TIGR03086 family metal-binding protein n=1 Tax=Streptomyces sp. 8K308 TaxID=2530388 RepID=UPI001FB71118|nr:TIGR03086 family metal-binding protein [Streptomyces sp. 8K308]